MAQRRMFSKTITNSGKFLKMPVSSRLLYFDLWMNADDDWFAEWFTVMRMTWASEQDLHVLKANWLVHIFDDNVLVILDRKENNYIQKDRYSPSKYLTVYNMDTLCIQDGYTGKDRIGKVSIGNSQEWEKIDKVKQILNNLEELDRVNKKFPWIDIDWLELEIIKMLDWCKSPKWREIVNWKNFVENRFKDKKTWELIYKKIKVQLSDEDIRK